MWFFFFSIRLIRMSWNVSYFWTLSIFSSYSLLEERNKNMISASYYCWFREFFFFFFLNDCCQIIFGDLLRFWQRCQTLTLFDSVLRDNMVSQRWYLCLGRLPFCLSPWLSGWSHSPVSLISPTPLTWCPGFIKPSALTLSLLLLLFDFCALCLCLLTSVFFPPKTCKSWTISDSCLCYMWVLLLPLVTTCLFVIRRKHSSGIYIHPQNAVFLTRCFSCDHGLCFPRMIY